MAVSSSILTNGICSSQLGYNQVCWSHIWAFVVAQKLTYIEKLGVILNWTLCWLFSHVLQVLFVNVNHNTRWINPCFFFFWHHFDCTNLEWILFISPWFILFYKCEFISLCWKSIWKLLKGYVYGICVSFDWISPVMQHDCNFVKLGQGSRWGWPLHALSIVGHSSHIREPPLYLPKMGLDLVALIATHYGVDGPHPLAPHAS